MNGVASVVSGPFQRWTLRVKEQPYIYKCHFSKAQIYANAHPLNYRTAKSG